jgi:hyperosmotically inducible protein
MKNMLLRKMALAAALLSLGMASAAEPAVAPFSDADIAHKLVREIRMYSRYTIWDNVNFRVQDGNVVLNGAVSQPFKKADLGRLAQRVPGVASVTNDLKVLPLSTFDDQLRIRVARAIYSDSVLSRYALQAVPPIHIIVENGQVTLEGVVNNEMEKNVAGIRASGAGLSFGAINNNLRVENPAKRES